jgi:hypothetical protein
MLCPFCVKESKRSKLYPGLCSMTCMGSSAHYDENGNYHHYAPDVMSTVTYSCSEGHQFITETGARGEFVSEVLVVNKDGKVNITKT